MTGGPKRGTRASDPWLRPANPPPEFDIRRWTPVDPDASRFETPKNVKERKADRRRLLLNGDEGHWRIAKLINGCYDEEPCGQQFDPECSRTWRVNYVWRSAEAIEKCYADTPLTMATLAPAAGRIAPGELGTFSVRKHKSLLRTHLIRAGLGHVPVIGGLDVSYNEDAAKKWGPHWQFHDHLIFIGADREQIKTSLDEYYPETKTILEPIDTEPVTDLLGALSYCYKSAFFRRVSIIDSRGCRNTLPYKSIKDPHLRELASFLGSVTFSNRLFLRGFRRRGAVLVPTPRDD